MIRLEQLPDPEDCVYVDVETNAILLEDVKQIHALCIEAPTSSGSLRYSTLKGDKGIDSGVSMLKRLVDMGYTPVFHNGAGYDIQVIHKFYPDSKQWLTVYNSIDSFLLSCMMEPDRDGGHSLDEWGEAVGIAKVQNEDWSVCTDHMVRRCIIDCSITRQVYEYLYTEADRHKVIKSLLLEQEVSAIHQRQMNHGVYYDMVKALTNKKIADDLIEELEKNILEGAPWKTVVTGIPLKYQDDIRSGDIEPVIQKPFKKNGDYTANAIKFWGMEYIDKVQGSHVKIECTPLSLSNDADVKDFLLSLGWIPIDYNYKFEDGRKIRKSPKLTEDSYHSLPEGLGKNIANYRTYLHRSRSILNVKEDTSEIKGAVSQVRPDGRISAEALTLGTPTARYRHMKAVCNIPRPSSLFGKEIRETFAVPEDHLMIGIDLSGIESRMLAHYLEGYPGSEEIIETILATDKGLDFHSRNAKLWGVTRDIAKNGLYALMYGCYPKKLATTLGYDESLGEKLFNDFWKINGPIKLLVEDLEYAYKMNKGYIKGLDGRPLFVREKRKLLNTLLQNAATMVFKKWMTLCDQSVIHKKYKVHQIIAYHDELQFEFYGKVLADAEEIAEEFCRLAIEAGEYFGVKVETPADAKIGWSWADCH